MGLKFQTLNNAHDLTFNQLLAINNAGTIAGYFGSGATGHPNKGYTLSPPYGQGNYTNENFPTSAQTQVTGINNAGLTVGFWVDGVGDNLGFFDKNGSFTTALDPNAPPLGGKTPVTEQFLGVNDLGKTAGFYNDAAGNSHGFVYDINTGAFTPVNVAGATSVTATDINDKGDISGFLTSGTGAMDGFVDNNGTITTLTGPSGAATVQALGLNDIGQVVGSFTDAKGNTHGFIYNEASRTYTVVNDPNANGMTVVNGINDIGQAVGFYLDHKGNTDGMLVTLPHAPTHFRFETLNNAHDPTFNQLLAINNAGVIAGYFGSGATGHPNKGYTLSPPYGQGNYNNENFPTSAQTQVTGINNAGLTVGFWVDGAGDNLGFVDKNGSFTTALDPNAPSLGGKTPVTEQFLGVNDLNQAAGFYNDAAGNAHGFIYNIADGNFSAVNVAGASQVTATDINDRGMVSGFFIKGGVTDGFLQLANGSDLVLKGPSGATSVQALGLNNSGQVVGSFTDAAGNTHGFVFDVATSTYFTVDDPHAKGMTVVNGINDQGQLVGFYLDHNGNTDGMLVNGGDFQTTLADLVPPVPGMTSTSGASQSAAAPSSAAGSLHPSMSDLLAAAHAATTPHS